MARYILMAETGADLTPELIARYDVQIVPMHVSFGAQTKDDGAFPPEELFSYYEQTHELPKTSGCSPADFERAFDTVHAKYPDRHILHLAYSAATTCSYQSALIAAEGRDYVTSVDTKQVSAGQALVVLRVAQYLEEHPDCPVEEVVAAAEKFSRTCHMGFFPGDLVYLKAGGRVSNAAYLGAKILSLHPLIEIIDGKLLSTKKYRGKPEKVALKFLQDFVQKHQLRRDLLAFVNAPGLSQEVKDGMLALAKELGFQDILWIPTGCVVSTHSGPGGFGAVGFGPDQ